MRFRHVTLFGTAIASIASMAVVATLVFGRKWLWFGAGTAAALLAVHVTLNHIALGLGGMSVLGYLGKSLYGRVEHGPHTEGKVIHWAFWYDILVWLLTLGRERSFREKIIEEAQLSSGESVLDVGCGTGGLAIAAKRRVGAAGRVCGIDASPEMIARARMKADKAEAEVTFDTGVIEALPFRDASFDSVLSTLMLHHLPENVRRSGIKEMRRVLKPGGRLFVVDFGGDAHERHGWIRRHPNHAHFNLSDVMPEINDAGLRAVETGQLGFRNLQFVRAAAPSTV